MAPPGGLGLDTGVAVCPLEGGPSGDLVLVSPFAGGTLFALVDGLGHGPEAAEAAQAAGRVLQAFAGDTVTSLILRCHAALRHTRGAVMSLASLDEASSALSWAGVGNVEGVLLRGEAWDRALPPKEAILLRGGVVGYRLPPLVERSLPLAAGDTLILVSDGIGSAFEADLRTPGGASGLAGGILARHSRGTDDAAVLVARFLAGKPWP